MARIPAGLKVDDDLAFSFKGKDVDEVSIVVMNIYALNMMLDIT